MLDFYPTPPDVTEALMQFLDLPKGHILEPACGDGAMSEILKLHGHLVASSDLRVDTGYGAQGIDFLVDDFPCYDAIITNPPFAQSQAFIERALTLAPVVAMVMKSQYWHARKRLELFRVSPPAYVLALSWRPDFLAGERGGKPTMECIWSVWLEGQTDTRYRLLDRPVFTLI